VLISSHRKLLSLIAMVVNVAETSGRDQQFEFLFPSRAASLPSGWSSLTADKSECEITGVCECSAPYVTLLGCDGVTPSAP
jgi:hypothetical protein